MKLLVPLMSLALLGAAQPDAPRTQEGETDRLAGGTQDRMALDPDDQRCREAMSIARGRDGDVEFRREPASPDRPLPFRAVDYEIADCDLMVMTDGSLRPPPSIPEEPPRLRPAH